MQMIEGSLSLFFLCKCECHLIIVELILKSWILLIQTESGLYWDLHMFPFKCDFFLSSIEFLDISQNKNAETCVKSGPGFFLITHNHKSRDWGPSHAVCVLSSQEKGHGRGWSDQDWVKSGGNEWKYSTHEGLLDSLSPAHVIVLDLNIDIIFWEKKN